ncbi:adenylate/guanylate cyclase domain-containing protein [Hydrogenimonas thermophila]|uniref:CHASE2 domain-containing protein n=1 Tax=Hydrogenimonas thermophila TaxID=223786 RepID=UPI002936EE18|nr:adenylate/guanylate cyclase domain-containing protein [Hydrogenimonas thermophila]WOE69580.1 adenylate/guanylate cyclase domain-containing protein [Hydrogenimonas thermophila]WOE72094.1 adenylate/guanylate cyclase domain-containing protein [Hydrogenimonas thermophila]
MNKKKLYIISTSIIVTLSIIFGYLYHYELLNPFDKKIVDLMFKIRGYQIPSKDIVIIDIDEKSLNELGQWPWSRNKVAKILYNLKNAGAGIIGLDIVFSEQDNSSPKKILTELGIEYQNAPDYDEILAKAVSETPTILGYIFDFENDSNLEGSSPEIPVIFIEKNRPKELDFIIKAKRAILNIPIIQNNAYSSGFFNTIPDNDGIVRTVPLIVRYDDSIYPSLSLEIVRAIIGVNKVYINYTSSGVTSVQMNDLIIPTDRFGRLLVNFKGPAKSYTYLSASDIYNNKFNYDLINGKIVLIGTSASGLLDLRATPYDSTFPGIEIHANTIDNLINQTFITIPDWIEVADILVMITICLISVIIFSITPPFLLTLFIPLIFGGFFIFLYKMLFEYHILLNTIFPLLLLISLFSISTIINYFYEIRIKEIIKDKFAKKVSPQVVEELLNSPESDAFDIKEKEITIFFSDIRSFTSISEQIGNPKRLIELLNRYMTPMVDIIINNKGTIDKFIGDAIMAYWNAPQNLDNHQDAAVTSALEQLQMLENLNNSFKTEGLPVINIGIGIHTGLATVGEMGSQGRNDYTVIGDNVNLASRLEGLNKYYGTQLIISHFTKDKLHKTYITRELDTVLVKGKKYPVTIYEVLGFGTPEEKLKKELNLYEKDLSKYKNRDFTDAKYFFEIIYKNSPKTLYKIYIERCNNFIKHPNKFNAIYEFTTK